MMKVLLWCAALAAITVPALAVDLPGKVTLKVGTDVGTSNDKAGRLLAKYIGRYLSGTPEIAVENVPGASGALLAHQMVESEPKDGAVLGLVSTDLVRSHVVDPASMDFDPGTLAWLGALIAPVQLCVTNKARPITLDSLGSEAIKFGATVPNSANYTFAAILRTVQQGKFRIVTGFKNELDMMAALDRGEIDAYCGQTYSTYQREGREATQAILTGIGAAARLSELGISDMAAGLTGTDAAAIDLLALSTKGFYTFALPSGTPPEVVETYRNAFDKAMADPALAAEMREQFMEFSPSTGAAIEGYVAAAIGADPTVVERARAIVQ